MTKAKVGTKISFDEFRLNNELHHAAKKAKKGNAIVRQFNELGMLGRFTSETWESIKEDGTEPLRKQFNAKLNKELKSFSISVMRDNYKREAMAQFEPLMQRIETFLETGWGESYQNGFEHINLQFDDIIFENGKFQVDEEKAQEKATVRVEDEDEARLYELGTEIEPMLQEMLSIYKRKGLTVWKFNLNELFPRTKENDDQKHFNVNAVKWRNKMAEIA